MHIEQSSGLSKEEIERMQRDAEAHADEDKQHRELAAGDESREQSAAERPDQLQGDDDAIDAAFEVKK